VVFLKHGGFSLLLAENCPLRLLFIMVLTVNNSSDFYIKIQKIVLVNCSVKVFKSKAVDTVSHFQNFPVSVEEEA